MLNYAICDDESAPADKLEALIREWEADTSATSSVSRFTDAGALLADMKTREYDAVFLDIHLNGDINGMQAAEAIRKWNDGVLIIFVTNYMNYVLKGYEVHAFRYLIKPITRREVFSCLNAITAAVMRRLEQKYLWRSPIGEMSISYDMILYFEIFSHTIELHTAAGEIHTFIKRISDLENELPFFFIRCHRSVMVNIHHVFAIKKNAVELDTTVELPISQRRRKAVQEAFLRYRVNGGGFQ